MEAHNSRLLYFTAPFLTDGNRRRTSPVVRREHHRRIPVLLLLVLTLLVSTTGHAAVDCQEHSPKQTSKSGKKPQNILYKTFALLYGEYDVTLCGKPHLVEPIPIGYFDFRTGVNLGLKTTVTSLSPNPYELTLQILASHKGRHRHRLVFKYFGIAGSKFGVHFDGYWERDLEARYFGLGNESRNNDELTEPGSPSFIDEDFYLYNLKRPRFTVHGLYEFLPKTHFWFGYGLEIADPQLKQSSDTSFLGQDQPFGHLGGTTHLFSFRATWDTRSDSLFPTSGFLTELSFEPNFALITEDRNTPAGIQRGTRHVSFARYTFSTAHFLPIKCNDLIFANRVAFESIAGDAPYYAFGHFTGVRTTRAVGGSQSLRGYQSRRFQDRHKLITLTELRYRFRQMNLMSQHFDWTVTVFLDNGRVWNRWSDISVDGFHTTYGVGLWLTWDDNLTMRVDVGRSPEGIIPFIRFHTAF